jgi:hypothetical protein
MKAQMSAWHEWGWKVLKGKGRIYLAWFFAGLLVLDVRQFPGAAGLIVLALGAWLRYWASGFIQKNQTLSVGGPYRWTRNPLYLGTFLMAVGACISVHAWLLLWILLVAFWVLYDIVITFEETQLIKYFGKNYEEFCRLVPRFFPWKGPASIEEMKKVNPDPNAFIFSSSLAKQNRAMEAVYAFGGFTAFLASIALVKMMLF